MLSLVLFGPCVTVEEVGNKWNNRLSVTILWAVSHPGPPGFNGCVVQYSVYVSLGHSIVSANCRLHLLVQSEVFPTSTITSWVFTIPWTLVPALFVRFSLPLFFFVPFIVLVAWMDHVHFIKFPFRLVLGALVPILAISGNLILWFLDSPVFNIVK